MPNSANIARHLPAMAASHPDRVALKVPRGRDRAGRIDYLGLTFAELDREVDAWVAAMAARGLKQGDRTLVMVRQGLPLIASVFALFKMGAVPVVIDPGMGLKSFLRCVRHSRPRGLVGIPLARWMSRMARGAFHTVRVRIAASGALTSRRVKAGQPGDGEPQPVASVEREALAAILYTSGSTGPSKGVCYTHGMFEAQVRLIQDVYRIEPGEVDLPLLPIFALFNPALGMTTVVPEINPKRPALVDPAKIVQAIRQENVTNSFGSPTLWRKIAAHAGDREITLPSLKRVLCAGAPVPPSLWEAAVSLLPGGSLHSPYGATEALPVTTLAGPEALKLAGRTLQGGGTCVGLPVPGVRVEIIELAEGPLRRIADARPLPTGRIGEIIVRGANVTLEYDALPQETALAKIPDPEAPGGAWHRMGDCGYLDEAGRLWFCGRKAERVETHDGPLFTEQVEPIFNQHPGVRRTALVGLGPKGRQEPVLVVEAARRARANGTLARGLSEFALKNPLTARITGFVFHPAFPVDVRHNAKIHRLKLASWAERQKRFEVG